MKFRSLSPIFMLVLGVLLTMAAVGQSIPDESDNECYTGGMLDGQCVSDWHWECGWYLHNWLVNPGAPVPNWCGDITNRSVSGPYPGCVYNGSVYNDYTNFGNSLFLAENAPVFSDSQCTQKTENWTWRLVYASTPVEAETLCQAAFGTATHGIIDGTGRIYGCY